MLGPACVCRASRTTRATSRARRYMRSARARAVASENSPRPRCIRPERHCAHCRHCRSLCRGCPDSSETNVEAPRCLSGGYGRQLSAMYWWRACSPGCAGLWRSCESDSRRAGGGSTPGPPTSHTRLLRRQSQPHWTDAREGRDAEALTTRTL